MLVSQRDTTFFLINVQNNNVDFLTVLQNFAWVYVLVCPRQFRHMDQPFDIIAQVNKCTVISQRRNLTRHCIANIKCLGRGFPWIFFQLFCTQRNTMRFWIKLDNFDFDFFANMNQFAWMIDAFPRQICDVQQTVNSAQINKHTVISNVFHRPFDNRAQRNVFHRFFLLCSDSISLNRATRNDCICAQSVHFQNAEFVFQANQ